MIHNILFVWIIHFFLNSVLDYLNEKLNNNNASLITKTHLVPLKNQILVL